MTCTGSTDSCSTLGATCMNAESVRAFQRAHCTFVCFDCCGCVLVALFFHLCNIPMLQLCACSASVRRDSASAIPRYKTLKFRHCETCSAKQNWIGENCRFHVFRKPCSASVELLFRHCETMRAFRSVSARFFASALVGWCRFRHRFCAFALRLLNRTVLLRVPVYVCLALRPFQVGK